MTQPWGPILALSAGGVLGVNARYWLGYWFSRWLTHQFPWATFVINVTGSFAIGFLTVALARWLPHPNVRLFMVVGFLGGYTTFSTFAFDSLILWERGEVALSLANMAGSVAAGLVAVSLGLGLARVLVVPASERAPRADPGIRGRLAPQGPALPRLEPEREPANGQAFADTDQAASDIGERTGEDRR
jgi:fluoride exporter